jgi:hypothetical protein
MLLWTWTGLGILHQVVDSNIDRSDSVLVVNMVDTVSPGGKWRSGTVGQGAETLLSDVALPDLR